MTRELPAGISAQDVKGELASVQASPSFASSVRHRKFLTFVVEETLAGRANRIKAYTIATAVFGRADSFDPQQDSIVRIEAGRLRRAIEHHYLTDGADRRMRILIPKGTYVPRFDLVDEGDAGKATLALPIFPLHLSAQCLRVFVSPLENYGGGAAVACAARLTRSLIMGLSRFVGVQVYGTIASELQRPRPELHLHSGLSDVGYILTGAVTFDARNLILELLLQECPSGRFVWTEQFHRVVSAADPNLQCNDLAAEVVQRLVESFGIPLSHASDGDVEAPRHLGSYREVSN